MHTNIYTHIYPPPNAYLNGKMRPIIQNSSTLFAKMSQFQLDRTGCDSISNVCLGFLGETSGKNPPANLGDIGNVVQSMSWEDPLEEVMVTHFNILAWRIPCTEEPGRV